MRVWGSTLQELFLNSLKGIGQYLLEDSSVKGRDEKRVREKFLVEAVDIHSLLVEFMSHVLARMEMGNILFTGAIFERFGDDFIQGELVGNPISEFTNEISGIAYEGVEIKKDPATGRFETTLMFDT